MSEKYPSAALKTLWEESLRNARNNYNRAKRQRTAAAISDFATNLLTMIGRGNGIRYNIAPKPVAGSVAAKFDDVREQYRKAMLDYKGKIAAQNLMRQGSSSSIGNKSMLTNAIVPPVIIPNPTPSKTIMDEIKSIKTPSWLTQK